MNSHQLHNAAVTDENSAPRSLNCDHSCLASLYGFRHRECVQRVCRCSFSATCLSVCLSVGWSTKIHHSPTSAGIKYRCSSDVRRLIQRSCHSSNSTATLAASTISYDFLTVRTCAKYTLNDLTDKFTATAVLQFHAGLCSAGNSKCQTPRTPIKFRE